MDERGGDDIIFVASLVDGDIVNDTSSVDVVFSDIGTGDVFVSNIVSDVSSVHVICSDLIIMTSLMVTTPCQMIRLWNQADGITVEATKRTFSPDVDWPATVESVCVGGGGAAPRTGAGFPHMDGRYVNYCVCVYVCVCMCVCVCVGLPTLYFVEPHS